MSGMSVADVRGGLDSACMEIWLGGKERARLQKTTHLVRDCVLRLFKKDICLYEGLPTWLGLVQPQDKSVVRCAITIYPYSFALGVSCIVRS